MTRTFFLACAIVLSASTWPARAQPAPDAASDVADAASDDGCFRYGKLFDPGQPPGVVATQMANLQRKAEQGNAEAAYVLGTLYRLGPTHPAKRLPQDVDVARQWLAKAALAGNLMAMAGLAEIELAGGRPMDGMVMAQSLVHFSARHPASRIAAAHEYQAGLVARAYAALGLARDTQHDERVLAAFNAFIAQFGPQIEESLAVQKATDASRPRECAPEYDAKRWQLTREGSETIVLPPENRWLPAPGYVEFWLQVAADGSVADVLVIDALPGAEVAARLQPGVRGWRFNPMPGAPVRHALAPMTLGGPPPAGD